MGGYGGPLMITNCRTRCTLSCASIVAVRPRSSSRLATRPSGNLNKTGIRQKQYGQIGISDLAEPKEKSAENTILSLWSFLSRRRGQQRARIPPSSAERSNNEQKHVP